ncbi:response regulator [Aromatoleum toluvorans]|uniref:Response regulator n=1 Tax=Aromatoleum toluvorans TaxID=92002 RepID=A0ABX1Q1A7_9RHOO|nr:response regulator [Aromatoleum toluvorans]NMG45128.1 response regulator [Aromatoleum toluvorans]
MGARILVIEDNAPNRNLMSYLITAFGHTPITAESGISGIEAAEREKPDLIVCDIQMPGIDGYEVARRLKGDPRLEPIPLVAVTAYAMVGDQERVLAAGFDGYIPKPIVPRAFVGQLETFLHRRRRTGSGRKAPVQPGDGS